MQTPAQAAAHEHAALINDLEDVRDYLLAALKEGPQLRCNGSVHIEMVSHTDYHDGTDPYVLFVVTREGMDRFYRAFMRIEPSSASPAITMGTDDPHHQHGG